MYDVKGNLHEVLGSLPAGVRLVAISKFHPNEYIEAAYSFRLSTDSTMEI